MALLFCHGIHENRELIDGFYDVVTSASVNTFISSRHTGGANTPQWNDAGGFNDGRLVIVGDLTEVYAGIAFNHSGDSWDARNVLVFNDSANNLLFRVNAHENDRSLSLRDGSGNEILRTDGSDWGGWTPLAIHLVIDGTNGEARLWLGETIAKEVTGINTGTTPIDRVGWGTNYGNFRVDVAYEDFWIDDAKNHADARVASLRPDANGNYQDWLRSDTAVSAYTLVNDQPGDTNTYLYTDLDDQRETFDVDAVPADSQRPNVGGVMVWSHAAKTDAADRFLANTARVGGIDYDGPEEEITDATVVHNLWEQNPDTGAAWTVSEIDGSEFGMMSGFVS